MPDVYVSTVIDAPVARVWDAVRDFGALHKWFPPVTDTKIESGAPTQPGCIRDFGLPDGGRMREELLQFSDAEFLCEYRMLSTPLPITSYVASVRLAPVTDGDRCFAELRSRFTCAPAQEKELAGFLAQTYQGAFDGVKQRLAKAAGA